MERGTGHSAPAGTGRILGQQRWYADKGRQIAAIASDFQVDVDIYGDTLSIELLGLSFEEGSPSTYLFIWNPNAPDQDCLERPDVRRWLLDGFEEGRELHGNTGSLRWTGSLGNWRKSDQSRLFRGEQSNSSIVYADQIMVKVFRKIQPGQNPEVEIGEHLTRTSDFDAFPKLLGTVDLLRGDERTTVACAQQFIQSVGDAWSWLLESLDRVSFANAAIESMWQLGRRTAELHLALSTGGEPAFAPEIIDGALAARLRHQALDELDETIALLNGREDVDATTLAASLATRLDDFALLEGTVRIRIHGDYHLGQVLRTENEDFAILDFEGEPSRSLAERREKASPLRDVAGMLRSLDYLSESAHRQFPGATPDGFAQWNQAARTSFVDGYMAVGAERPLFEQANAPARWQRLVAAFEVQKALYETRYELGNRPDWVDIPLNGLRRLARQAS